MEKKSTKRWFWGCIGPILFLCFLCSFCGWVGDFNFGVEESATPTTTTREERRSNTPSPVQTEDVEENSGSNRSFNEDCRIAFLDTYPEKGTYLPAETVLFQGETIGCENVALAITNDDSGETIHLDGEDNYVAADWTAPNGTADFNVCLYGWDSTDSVQKECHHLTISGPEAVSWNGRTLANGEGDCERAYEPQMNVGETGEVTPGDPSTLWSGPGSSDGDRIAKLPAGSEFLVVGNGVCQNGYIWWPVLAKSNANWDMQMSGIPMNEEIFGYLTEGRPDQGGGRWIAPK